MQSDFSTVDTTLLAPARASARRHVFISYSRENSERVHAIAGLLSKQTEIWIDSEALELGTSNWQMKIREGIRDAYAVIYMGSPGAASSNYVQAEIEIATTYNLIILPVWIAGDYWSESALLAQISNQYIDLRTVSDQESAEKLLVNLVKLRSVSPSVPINLPEVSNRPSQIYKENPYCGLFAFQESDSARYFGRDKESGKVRARLEAGARFTAVLGASGSGKSSLVKAGVLAKLAKEEWHVISTVPDVQPFLGLANEMADGLSMSIGDVETDLRRADGCGLALLTTRLLTRKNKQRLLIFIDQFEEVFTRPLSEADRFTFLNLLTATAKSTAPVQLLITMRADFYDRPMTFPQFHALLSDHVPLVRLGKEELRDAIVKPAEAVGLRFEDGLVGDVLYELREESGALPFLQFTLDLLFRRCITQPEDSLLTVAAYRDIGGVRGALARYAEERFLNLDEAQQRISRFLFMRLIEPGTSEGDAARRRALRRELTLPDAQDNARMNALISYFADARLLVTDRIGQDETVEIAHESLIREWERMKAWNRDQLEEAGLKKMFQLQVREWIKHGRPSDLLQLGARLKQFEQAGFTSELSAEESEYFDLSKSLADVEYKSRVVADLDGRGFSSLKKHFRHRRGVYFLYKISNYAYGIMLLVNLLALAAVVIIRDPVGNRVAANVFVAVLFGSIAIGLGLASILSVVKSLLRMEYRRVGLKLLKRFPDYKPKK